MIQDDIERYRDGSTLVIRFARPHKKNALTLAMYRQMTAGLQEAAVDASVRAVVFGSTSDIFTAGNDLGDFMEHPVAAEDSPAGLFLAALDSFPKPLVAAVDGKAIGVGFTMLLHCDLVYASDRAVLVAPFVDLGLVPEAGSSLLLPRRVGHARAAEVLMLSEPLEAPRALAMGLFNAVLPAGQVFDRALSAARRLGEKAPQALALTKALLKDAPTHTAEERMRKEAGLFLERLKSPEVAEAVAAFFEKRKPDFSKF